MPHSRLRLQTDSGAYLTLLKHIMFGDRAGSYRDQTEAWLRDACECPYAITTNQGRVAQYAAIKASITAGKNRIILSPYTLYEVVNMVIYAGGEPVFVDTVPNAPFVSASDVERRIDDKTAAIMITHYHLPVPETEDIAELAKANGLKLIEDAAVSFGAKLNDKPVGTFGDAGAFSFGLFKIINAFYGGALISTNEGYFQDIKAILDSFPKENRERLFKRGVYGAILDTMTHPLAFNLITFPLIRYSTKSNNSLISNFTRADASPSIKDAYPPELQKQPTESQFKLVWNGLKTVREGREVREQRARRYLDALSDIDDIILPDMPNNAQGSWTEFPIVIKDRRDLYTYMLERNRDIRYYYYRNCADLPIYRQFHHDCPNARDLMHNTLMLPLYPRYPDAEIERNIQAIREYYGK